MENEVGKYEDVSRERAQYVNRLGSDGVEEEKKKEKGKSFRESRAPFPDTVGGPKSLQSNGDKSHHNLE